jgi:protein PsiE
MNIQRTFKNTVHRVIMHMEKALLLFIVAGTVWAAGYDIMHMFTTSGKMALADLFLLFIYAEILGMVGAFYKDHRIPVTLPIIIAITALTRMIVLTTKGTEPEFILYETAGIFILAVSAYILSAKDKLSLEKIALRTTDDKNILDSDSKR